MKLRQGKQGSRPGGGAAAAPALVVFVSVTLLALGGCALTRQPATGPVDAGSAERSEPEPRAEATVVEPSEVASLPALGAVEPPPVDVPVAGEPTTESPLDELAVIAPTIEPEELEKNLDLVIDEAPTYDIPIVINERVLAWVDLYSRSHKRSFESGLRRSGLYMERFRQIFAEEGLPQDLVYMAHVESGYKTSAYSRARAKGIFQFIAATGKRYGLRIDYWVDERSDPEKSARAAALYMKDLYEEFGDWYLALAGYNAGEGKVRRAIDRTGSRDFWTLARTRHLKRETKNHIPAILAATILSKEPAKYGLIFDPEPPLLHDTIEVSGPVDLLVLARCAGSDLATLVELNPGLRRGQTPPDGRTAVHVPAGAGLLTAAAIEAIPPEGRVLYQRYRVKNGDTLSVIARRHGVSVQAIQQANNMGRRTMIRVNQQLKVPSSAAARYTAEIDGRGHEGARGQVVVHRVRRGETLYGIARRYQTSPKTIAATNDISVNSVLHIGDRLTVVHGVYSISEAREASGLGAADDGREVVHTVSKGDTLWAIASLYRTTVNTICAMNQITPHSILRPGAQLTVGYR